MENYSDFDPFYLLNIGFTFVDKDNVDALDRCDIIIMPGSKLVAEESFNDMEFKDIFTALNGATLYPFSAK